MVPLVLNHGHMLVWHQKWHVPWTTPETPARSTEELEEVGAGQRPGLWLAAAWDPGGPGRVDSEKGDRRSSVCRCVLVAGVDLGYIVHFAVT